MTPESWVFRVASRPEYGGGHVRRCLALARAVEPFAPVVFALDPGGEHWRETLAAAGFTAVADDDGARGRVAGAVVDHCEPDPAMVSRWRRRTGRLVVFRDDIASDAIDGADIEIRQWAEPAKGPGLLAGPEYILIDPGFVEIPDAAIRPLPASLLVGFGMRDSPDATSLVLESLDRLASRWQPQVTVALGAGAPHVDRVRRRVAALGPRARLTVDAPDMRPIVAGCDIAVGAGGVSAAERASAGRPSLTLALNDSQRPVAALLAAVGATADCGPVQGLTVDRMADALWALAADPERRAGMARAGRRAVDGRGARRIAEALLEGEEPVS